MIDRESHRLNRCCVSTVHDMKKHLHALTVRNPNIYKIENLLEVHCTVQAGVIIIDIVW